MTILLPSFTLQMALPGFFLPHEAVARIRTHVRRVAPLIRNLTQEALPTELGTATASFGWFVKVYKPLWPFLLTTITALL